MPIFSSWVRESSRSMSDIFIFSIDRAMRRDRSESIERGKQVIQKYNVYSVCRSKSLK